MLCVAVVELERVVPGAGTGLDAFVRIYGEMVCNMRKLARVTAAIKCK